MEQTLIHIGKLSKLSLENFLQPGARQPEKAEIFDSKYKEVFSYPFFNMVQSKVIEDALYTDNSMVVCAPTGSGKTVIFEMAIVQLLMDIEERASSEDFKIIYMAPVKALCTERLTEWYSKYNKLGLLSIEVTGDTNVDFTQLQAYKIIITTPEKWDMLTRRWRDHRGLVEMIKLFLIDEVHILNDEVRGPVLEAVVSRMKTVESSAQSAHRIEKLQKQYKHNNDTKFVTSKESAPPRIRFVAVSATINNPEDVAAWLGTPDRPAVYYKFGDECRPVKLKRIVEGYPCSDGTSIFKFDIILSYKLWPIIQKYYDGKPTLIFCNTRKSVLLTAETLSREITITFSPEQKTKLTVLASTIKNKKLQSLVLAGVGCHHAGMVYEERLNVERAFRNRDLPILVTTTTLAMGVNLPAHLVIIKNTQQYVNGAYQEYSISTVLQMVGRAGRPQFDTEATAVIMTRQKDKARYQALVGGSEPLQSYLHKRLAENLNSEAALGTVGDVAQCVQWLRSTFLYVRAAKDPKRYLGLPPAAPSHQICKKIEEMCVIAMNGLASSGLITMDEASCIESTEAGRLMSVYYLDLETMKLIMKIQGNETMERLMEIICESHELADMHLRVDERRCLNTLNRNNTSATIRFPMKGKINSRQMKLNCIIQAILGCLPIPDPSLNQEAMKVMRIAERICSCLVAYVTRSEVITQQWQCFSAVLNSIILAKCIKAHLWENSPYVSKQFKGIGPTFSTLLATAGKVNILLLEESHPRDLERIMNKGPPAGNFLKKQISLLPKYQLISTPVDERTMTVKLNLINQVTLAENMDNLTAGESHKCYIIAGDSENHVLFLTTFKDKDLISVYDGIMTFQVIRKHNFEHKIFIRCISSTFVGIDVQCEYIFMSLLPSIPDVITKPSLFATEEITAKNQSNIPNERKRKTNNDITQSKEKKKRDNALVEKLRVLKQSFTKVTNDLKNKLQSTENMSESLLNGLVHSDLPILNEINKNVTVEKVCANTSPTDVYVIEDTVQDDEFVNFTDNETIDNILNEIENEITLNNKMSHTVLKHSNENNKYEKNTKEKFYSSAKNVEKQKHTTKPNYKFLNLLEKNGNFSDEEDISKQDNGFSDSIKSHVSKYMQIFHDSSSNLDLESGNICKESEDTDPNGSTDNIANNENISYSCLDNKTLNTKFHPNICLRNASLNIKDYNKLKRDESGLLSLPNGEYRHINFIEKYNTNENGSTSPTLTCWDIDNNKEEKQICHLSEVPSEHENIELLPTHNNIANNTFSSNELQENNEKDKPVNDDKTGFAYCSELQKLQTSSVTEFQLYDSSQMLNKDNDTIKFIEKLSITTRNKNDINNSNIKTLELLTNPESHIPNYNDKKEQNEVFEIPLGKKTLSNSTFLKYVICYENEKEDIIQNKNCLTPTPEKESNFVKNNFKLEATEENVKSVPTTIDLTNEIVRPFFQYSPSLCLDLASKKIDKHTNQQKIEKQKNKYLFSTEKSDVSTKFSAGHEIRIIRKLKLDIDITEIIHDKKNETTLNKNILNENDIHSDVNQINCKEPMGQIEFIEKENVNTRNYDIIHKNPGEDRNNIKSNEIPSEPKCENDNIASILKKYRKIIRKNDKKEKPTFNQSIQTINNNKKIESKKFQSTKPFKISDLQHHNMNIPIINICDPPDTAKNLTSTLNEDSETLTTTLLDQYCDKNKENNSITINNCPTIPDYEDLNDYINIGQIPSPTNIYESQTDIDHCMLDPKRMLQCFKKDDYLDIIPPAPEFSDNIQYNYSPENMEWNTSEDPSFEPIDTLTNEATLTMDNSNSQVEPILTLPTEIETWTLDKCLDRNSMPSFSGNSIPSTSLRKGKLSQFKFNRKFKYKI